MRALLLPVGNDFWCLPFERVLEVLNAPRVTPLPLGRAGVVGLFNLRGEVLPLFDTAVLLGQGRSALNHAVVVENANTRGALSCSAVPRSVELGDITGSPEHAAAIASYDTGTEIAVLLDLDHLLQP